LGWQGKRLEELRFGAILHDIGKIHVRETILCKQGPLNAEEWEEIKQHPKIGASMVKNIPYLTPAIPAIKYHHERWDGSGYPYGLAGDEIPVMARIVSVADAFDAMTSSRAYQKARSLQVAYDEILDVSKEFYDPHVVAAFSRAWELGEIQVIAETAYRENE
jgi:HD-GYP domain-containing protein (c-di-GMP phosphodiesterase class II)